MDNDEHERLYRTWLNGFAAGAAKSLRCAVAGLATGRDLETIKTEVMRADDEILGLLVCASVAQIENAKRID